MKVIIATDSFKGSCSSLEAAAAIERGILRAAPSAQTVCLPVADGGEGTVRAMISSGGQIVRAPAHDPLGRPISAEYGILPDGTAIIETAAASGLTLLQSAERDVLRASSYGTGELIRHALMHGAGRIILALGGSATIDGGLGLLQALGVSFTDAAGAELGAGPAALSQLHSIDVSGLLPEATRCSFVAACDVRNPLLGPQGAAAVFGPQKGAAPAQIKTIDAALSHYAAILSSSLGRDVSSSEGAGAAGGIGFAMLAFFHAAFRPGIDIVLDSLHFDAALADADLVITGEGRIDAQSAYGKVPAGVARRTKSLRNIPVIAIGGTVERDADTLYSRGVDGLVSAVSQIVTLDDAMKNAEAALENAALRTMQLLQIGASL